MAARLANPLWQHFTEPTPGKAKCNICDQIVSMGSTSSKNKNTTNVWHHLKSRHQQIYQETKRKKEELALSAPIHQQTRPQVSGPQNKWKETDSKSKKIDAVIAEMCATDNQPFSVVSGVGFQRLMATLEPRYTVKTEKFYRTNLLDQLHKKVQTRVRAFIAAKRAEPFLSFTADCCTAGSESLMNLTCHFIDGEWERRQVVLHAKAMTTESSSADYVGQFFRPLLKYWNINQSRVFMVLRDSGADITEELRLTEVPDLSCSAHSIQRVVEEGVDSQQDVLDVIGKVRTCAVHFQHSVLAKQRLRMIQNELNVPQNGVILDTPTRWSSTLQMLRRVQEQRRAVGVYVQKYGNFSPPTAEEWDLIKNLIETLAPFEEVTGEMSKSESSISCIIPSVSVLKMILQAEGPAAGALVTLRQTMLQSLERRYAKIEETKLLVLATLLDPRYKCNVLSAAALNVAPKWLREEHTALSALRAEEDQKDQGPEPKQTKLEENPSLGLVEQMYASILGAPRPQLEEGKKLDLSEQLEKYLNEPLIDRKLGDPLQWWRQNAARFDLLAPMARKFLSAPPSSVPAERMWTEHDEERQTDENAEKLYFLHYNLPLLKWNY